MIVGFYAYKGGTGKTTLAAALGTCPALGTSRVLLSLDPQEDLPAAFGMLGNPKTAASATAFRRWIRGEQMTQAEIAQVSYPLPDGTRLCVNSSSMDDLRDLFVLRRLLHAPGLAKMQFVVDLPPRDSTLAAVGLTACDVVVCPVLLDVFGVAGAMRTLLAVQRLVSVPRPPIAVLRNRVRSEPDKAAMQAERDLLAFCSEHGADGVHILNVQVRDRTIFRYCASVGRPIWELTPFHGRDVQADIMALAEELKNLKEGANG